MTCIETRFLTEDEERAIKLTVQELKRENHELRLALQQNDIALKAYQEDEEFTRREIQLLTNMKEVIEQQRGEIRRLKKELNKKAVEMDALQQQVNRLMQLNANLRQRQGIFRRKSEGLVGEKNALECQLQVQEQLIQRLRLALGDQHTSFRISITSDSDPVLTTMEETSEAFSADEDSKMSAPDFKESEDTSSCCSTHPPQPFPSEEDFLRRLNEEGKAVIDLNDPQRPRFSLQELTHVLTSKNELACRLHEAEEALRTYRDAGYFLTGDVDAPVEGPINREPPEKLRFDRNSEKRGSFRSLFDRLLRSNKERPCESSIAHMQQVEHAQSALDFSAFNTARNTRAETSPSSANLSSFSHVNS